MNGKCLFGFHSWTGCKCSVCGKMRDEQHDWSKNCAECSRCAKKRDGKHVWGENFGACTSCGAKDPVRSLIGVIADPNQADYKSNQEAAQKLKLVCSDQALESVIELLKSSSCRVRSHAAQALKVIGDKRAVGPLMEFLRKPYQDERISYYSFAAGGRGSAVLALGELAGKEAVPMLIEVLEDPSWGLKGEAVREIHRLGDESATEALGKLVSLPVPDESKDDVEGSWPAAKLCALDAIKRFGDRRAVPALVKAVASPSARIRDKAIEVLKKFPDVIVERPIANCAVNLHLFEHGKCSACGKIRRHHCGFTDLHLAIHKEVDLIEVRNLASGGLVNVGDEEGFTPLMKASGGDGSLAIVKLLVELGADINARSMRGTTAASMAALHAKQDVTDYLASRGAVIDFVVRRS